MVFLYIPCPNLAAARRIGTMLLRKNLITCANIFPVLSIYRWKKKLVEEKEVILIAKTTRGNVARAKNTVARAHPYRVPCIADFTVTTNTSYRAWALQELGRNKN